MGQFGLNENKGKGLKQSVKLRTVDLALRGQGQEISYSAFKATILMNVRSRRFCESTDGVRAGKVRKSQQRTRKFERKSFDANNAHANSNANPLMLLACSVDTPIHINRFLACSVNTPIHINRSHVTCPVWIGPEKLPTTQRLPKRGSSVLVWRPRPVKVITNDQ